MTQQNIGSLLGEIERRTGAWDAAQTPFSEPSFGSAAAAPHRDNAHGHGLIAAHRESMPPQPPPPYPDPHAPPPSPGAAHTTHTYQSGARPSTPQPARFSSRDRASEGVWSGLSHNAASPHSPYPASEALSQMRSATSPNGSAPPDVLGAEWRVAGRQLALEYLDAFAAKHSSAGTARQAPLQPSELTAALPHVRVSAGTAGGAAETRISLLRIREAGDLPFLVLACVQGIQSVLQQQGEIGVPALGQAIAQSVADHLAKAGRVGA